MALRLQVFLIEIYIVFEKASAGLQIAWLEIIVRNRKLLIIFVSLPSSVREGLKPSPTKSTHYLPIPKSRGHSRPAGSLLPTPYP